MSTAPPPHTHTGTTKKQKGPVNTDDLHGFLAYGEGNGIHLLEHMSQLGRVQSNDRNALCRRIARVKGGIPLAILVAKTHTDDVGLLQQRACADEIHARTLIVVVHAHSLITQDYGAAVVGVFVRQIRRRQFDGEIAI